MNRPRIFLSAGEPSGDMHGAALARALRKRWPDAHLYGLGGPLMAAEGVTLVAHVKDLAVMGIAEVAGRLPFFLNLLDNVREDLRRNPPDLVIPIDYPGFNMRLARYAKAERIPVLYYIAPQVWAWHRSRIHKLARISDTLAVILPFEEKMFRDAGGNAHFIGHPLVDTPRPTRSREAFCAEVGIDPAKPILALFPGSRAQEVERLLVPFADAARRIRGTMPNVQTVIAAGTGLRGSAYAASSLPRTTHGWELLHHARAAIVKSGTGTLQAALAGTPLVIAYKMNAFTFAIAQHLVEVPHVGLVNLVAGERLAPELIQDYVTGSLLAKAVLPLLDMESPERKRAVEGLKRVSERLRAPEGSLPAADRVAELAAELLARAGARHEPGSQGRRE